MAGAAAAQDLQPVDLEAVVEQDGAKTAVADSHLQQQRRAARIAAVGARQLAPGALVLDRPFLLCAGRQHLDLHRRHRAAGLDHAAECGVLVVGHGQEPGPGLEKGQVLVIGLLRGDPQKQDNEARGQEVAQFSAHRLARLHSDLTKYPHTMDTLQFALFFAALLVAYVLVHMRLVRFEAYLKEMSALRGAQRASAGIASTDSGAGAI